MKKRNDNNAGDVRSADGNTTDGSAGEFRGASARQLGDLEPWIATQRQPANGSSLPDFCNLPEENEEANTL